MVFLQQLDDRLILVLIRRSSIDNDITFFSSSFERKLWVVHLYFSYLTAGFSHLTSQNSNCRVVIPLHLIITIAGGISNHWLEGTTHNPAWSKESVHELCDHAKVHSSLNWGQATAPRRVARILCTKRTLKCIGLQGSAESSNNSPIS